MKTASLQGTYDSILKASCHDAVAAFELNTQGDAYSNNAESIRRDILASINILLSGINSGMGLPGESVDYVKPYIPAVLITLYDGYYIYAPTKSSEGNYKHVLKPYVYYSEKYESGNNYVVVNYSLDNYVAIYGEINGNVISNSGYLEADKFLTYISENGEQLSENVKTEEMSNSYPGNIYTFKYFNGRKVYYINNGWYYINDKTPLAVNTANAGWNADSKDYSARDYKNKSQEFMKWLNDSGVKSIVTPKNAVRTKDENVNTQILDITSNNDPENPLSFFNQQKRNVIQTSIQDNLNNAIAAYNENAGGLDVATDGSRYATFILPKMEEYDWQKIITNVNFVAFMQGVPVGNKIYNNYAIVTSTNNKQYISPNSIYMCVDGIYHTVQHLADEDEDAVNVIGYKSSDFKKFNFNIDENKRYYKFFRRKEYACYVCLVERYTPTKNLNTNGEINIYSLPEGNVKNSYFTALARERYNLDKATKSILGWNDSNITSYNLD